MQDLKECWKAIPGFPGYEVSNLGRVKGIRVGLLKHMSSGRGGDYSFVNLYRRDAEGNSIRKNVNVHTLVAEAFIGPRPKGMVVHHKDGNRQNPRLDNLEYITEKENSRLHVCILKL